MTAVSLGNPWRPVLYSGMPEYNVIVGDCTEVMQSMPAGSIDIVVCSPPYNKKVKYNTYKDNKPYRDYLEWTDQWITQVARLLTDDGTLWVNIGSYSVNPLLDHDVVAVATKYLRVQERIVWQKVRQDCEGVYRGQYRPTPGDCYLDTHHEYVYMFSKSGRARLDRYAPGVGRPYTSRENEARWSHGRTLSCCGDLWPLPYTPRQGASPHPAQFPIGLPERCIRLHGLRDDLRVLDPFGGIGSTLIASKRCGVHGTMIEIDEAYCDLARRRVDGASNKIQLEMF